MNLKFFFDTENDVLNHRPESTVLNFAPAMYTVGYDELKRTPRPRRTGGDGCLQGSLDHQWSGTGSAQIQYSAQFAACRRIVLLKARVLLDQDRYQRRQALAGCDIAWIMDTAYDAIVTKLPLSLIHI